MLHVCVAMYNVIYLQFLQDLFAMGYIIVLCQSRRYYGLTDG